MSKIESLREDLANALTRFEEALQKEETEFIRDSAIKRFELIFDIAWKAPKAFLEENHNTTCASPQSCFREAFRVGLIDYDDGWLEIAKTRNRTAHIYNEKLANAVYRELPQTLTLFRKLKDTLLNH